MVEVLFCLLFSLLTLWKKCELILYCHLNVHLCSGFYSLLGFLWLAVWEQLGSGQVNLPCQTLKTGLMAHNAGHLRGSIPQNKERGGNGWSHMCYKSLQVELSAGVWFIFKLTQLGDSCFLIFSQMEIWTLNTNMQFSFWGSLLCTFMVNKQQPARLNKPGPGGCTNKVNDFYTDWMLTDKGPKAPEL